MRIDIKDNQGNPRFSVHVDPANPPTVVKATDGRGPAVSLDWDRAVDDKGNLRHCPVCGCPEFYLKKNVPQLTVFALIIAAAVVASVFYGFGLPTPALIVLGMVLGVDLLIYLFAERYLVCYSCGSTFHETPLLPTDKPWDADLAERYRSDDELKQPEAGKQNDDKSSDLHAAETRSAGT
ncbi:MAG: hypothetical protein AAGH99_08900 [Planctomycetota bacterium]